MKYEKPSMELKWLEAREVFMSGSQITDGGIGDSNSGWTDGSSNTDDGFDSGNP